MFFAHLSDSVLVPFKLVWGYSFIFIQLACVFPFGPWLNYKKKITAISSKLPSYDECGNNYTISMPWELMIIRISITYFFIDILWTKVHNIHGHLLTKQKDYIYTILHMKQPTLPKLPALKFLTMCRCLAISRMGLCFKHKGIHIDKGLLVHCKVLFKCTGMVNNWLMLQQLLM